ncbi:DNA-directed RNA polymerase specialized sigma subunit, sigma24 family [Chitinophaga sp. YR627]|uniref:sigma-70 family RNA polymerase sigma factor n=1 Tax=Chitinophaga sp. YR627 TaxID=1881041 RepID=UPI0008EB5DB8|nr:sigma-70 family RNA polymerase sigma factor [Chitinophaga sp. YR627]SFP01985.1 DNA-directed RNA polymerase specialized sigma subunit, sigma24 family [Chitinophaga sp. YR627]
MDESIHNLLKGAKWEELIPKLTAYAVYLCTIPPYSLPGGKQYEDIVMDAIEKVFKGERQWDPLKNLDLSCYLKSVIKSLLSNEKRSKAAAIMKMIPEDLQVQHDDNTIEELYCREVDKYIISCLEGDAALLLVYKAIKDGQSPKQISEEYGLDIRNVRNIQKRLSRKLPEVLSQLQNVKNHD